MSGQDSRCVAMVTTLAEGELIAGMLRDRGLHAAVLADEVTSYLPKGLFSEGVRVMVAIQDVEAAQKLIDGSAGAAEPPQLNSFQRLVVRLLGGGKK